MAGVILYNNLLRSATITSETTITNFGIAHALDGRTSSQAGFQSGADRDTVFDFGSATSVDCVAFARHNFNTANATITISGSADNVSYTTLTTATFTDDMVYTKAFTSASYRYIRVRVNATASNAYCSDIYIGEKLDLERSQKHGFIKPEFADNDKVIANTTLGQNLAGITIQQEMKSVRFDLFYYTAAFFAVWETLAATMKSYPIYIVWNDNEQPFYCWPKSKIPNPAYAKNINGYYSVKMDMQGITQ